MADERGNSSTADIKQKISFLEATVVRLNVELARYQAKYPSASASLPAHPPSLSFSIGDPIPPWLVDSQHLSPLLASYDMRIHELEGELRVARDSEALLRSRSKALEAEVEALRRSSSLHPSSQQRSREPAGRGGSAPAHYEHHDEMAERLELLQEENDVLLEQQRLTQQELDAVRRDLVNASSGHRDREEAVLKATVMHAKVAGLEKEKEVMEEHLNKKRSDLASQAAAAASYKKSLDDLAVHKDILVKDNNELLAREKHLIGVNAALDQDVRNLREYQRLAEHERENLTKEREDLFNQLVGLERALGECERRENTAVQALQRAIAAAEEAKLQKEQASIREQQASKDVKRLTDRLAGLQTDIRDHYTKEIIEIRAQHKGQLERVQEEIRALTAEQGDLKALLDRAVRDKRAVEAEVSRLHREPHHEMERYQGEISRAQALSLALQNERDALAAQLEGLAASEMTARRALEKERSAAVMQSEEAVRKVKRLETDLVLSTEERHKLKQQLESLHKTHQELVVEKSTQIKALSQELTRLKKEFEIETRELASKLEERIEVHTKVEQQFQSLLDEQHRMRERWREETKSATIKFEHIVQEQKGENEQIRTRADDLAGRLASVLSDNELLSREHQDSVAILKQLRSQISLAEHHLNEALVREQSIRHDNSTLMAQLDQMALKHSMLLRVHPREREIREVPDDDPILKLQLENANKEIDALHEQVSNLKVEKRKLLRKLQLIKKGVLEKINASREEA